MRTVRAANERAANAGAANEGHALAQVSIDPSVAEFLIREAMLLDEWKLDEWLTLFEPTSSYLVPSTDTPAGGPDSTQMLIADSYDQLCARVTRLNSRNAHAENPRSRTRRFVSNVVVVGDPDGHEIRVAANFLVCRIKYGTTKQFIGRYQHVLSRTEEALKFVIRQAILDEEKLDVDGRISIIL